MQIPKILGQQSPGATTLTLLYRVPMVVNTTANTLIVCNRSGSSTSFRVSVAPGGEGDNVKHYLFYDAALAATETKSFTLDLKLSSLDEVRVYASAAALTFILFGTESL